MPADLGTAIGIDIGATTTRVGAVTSDGRLIASRTAPTSHTTHEARALIARLIDDVAALRQEAPDQIVSAIGLAVPGLIDATTPSIRRSVNLPFLEGDWLVRDLAAQSGLAVTLHTDLDAATWAEYHADLHATHTEPADHDRGAADAATEAAMAKPASIENDHDTDTAHDLRATHARRHAHTNAEQASNPRTGAVTARFAHLRLGSGVGLGLVADGRLTPVEPDRTTHARVLIVDERDDAPACPCGLRGCLELFASGQALLAAAESIGIDGGLPAFEQAISAGDVPALELLGATSGVIVRSLERIALRYAVDVIILGGGVLDHLPSLWSQIAASIRLSTPSEAIHLPHIERSRLGDSAGVLGAALLSFVGP